MLNNIIGVVIISITDLLLWMKLLNKKPNYKNYKIYIALLIMILMILLNYFLLNPILKVVMVLFIYIAITMYIFNITIKEAIPLSIINHLLYIISEVIVIMIVLAILNIQDRTNLVDTFFGTIYANISISLVVIILMRIPLIKVIYKKCTMLLKNQKTYKIVIFIFLLASCISIVLNFIYYNNNIFLLSGSCLLLIVFYLYFAIKMINVKTTYLNMYSKYNSTLEALKSYEDILDKYKVSNHENKNQLLMIRNMLGKDNEKNVCKYIDKIVKNEYEDDENIMLESSKIPSGGLRALVYSKLLYMKNNNIDFDLRIDRKIKSVELIDLDETINLDICKIIGVFLDNAIEETEKTKNSSVSIEFYIMNDKLNISISNTFEGFIDLDMIDEKKYTTKGNGHGYGLTLVKEIIGNNSIFRNIRKINDDVFTQILEIDI